MLSVLCGADGSHISLELMAKLSNLYYGSIYLFASEKSVLISEAVLVEKALGVFRRTQTTERLPTALKGA